MKRPRDSQRQKVYDAEAIAFNFDDPRHRLDIDGAQTLVNRVFSSQTLRDRYAPLPFNEAPLVRLATHGRYARGSYLPGENEIRLARWTVQDWYVLHECAHALTCHYGGAWHDHVFAKCYLDLLRVYKSRFEAEALERAFKSKKVRYKPPRTQTISDAERERRRQHGRSLHV